MNISEFKRKIKNTYPVLMLERRFPWKGRRDAKRIFLVVIVIGIFLLISFKSFFGEIGYSLALIGMSFYLIVFSLDAYYYSYYFTGLKTKISEGDTREIKIPFETAYVVALSPDEDLLAGFLNSRLGRKTLYRLGIGDEDIQNFLQGNRTPIRAQDVELQDEIIYTPVYSSILFSRDSAFRDWLFKYGVNEEIFMGAASWVHAQMTDRKRARRWWSRENLGKIPSIGRDWAFGNAYGLMRFGSVLSGGSNYSLAESKVVRKKELDELEASLIKSKGSNALLVGDEGVGKLDIVVSLAAKINDKKTLPGLHGKTLIVLNTDLLIAENKNKVGLENAVMQIFSEAIKAGNVIVVIRDLPSFIQGAQAIGSNVINIIEPFFESGGVKFICLSTRDGYQKIIRTEEKLNNKLEVIEVRDADDSVLVEILQDKTVELETRMGVFVTYTALLELVKSAKRFFVDSSLQAKALTLLEDVVSDAVKSGKKVILKENIVELIKEKTGVPVGAIDESEKTKLLNLESILHARVIGQEEAIIAISNAMRRARSGVSNPNRPLGSFLFIGPTGVGKTETTKALAEAFFGSENKIMRLDMSEYNTEESLSRLIGSFQGNQTGVLTTMVRENPYGVLLLDEFEKTNPKVLDLFLQVLDEGIFSDMLGKKVNARNLIIIATSNAGSDVIWKLMQEGAKLNESKGIIIDQIIQDRIFKPELVNRFDGVILFHPLREEHLQKVAEVMLGKLKERLRERGIDLVVNNELISYLVRVGSDPKFGARPLNRAIQEKIESLIADKLIKGELIQGSQVALTDAELATL